MNLAYESKLGCKCTDHRSLNGRNIKRHSASLVFNFGIFPPALFCPHGLSLPAFVSPGLTLSRPLSLPAALSPGLLSWSLRVPVAALLLCQLSGLFSGLIVGLFGMFAFNSSKDVDPRRLDVLVVLSLCRLSS
jgi:hypothetical protein